MRSSPPEGLVGLPLPRFGSLYTGEPPFFGILQNQPPMNPTRLRHVLPVLLAAAALAALAGCGSDSSGETSSTTAAAIPTVTSPLSTPSTAATTTAGKKEKGEATNTTGGVSGGCTIPDAFQNFKFTGLDCTAAVAVATAWDANPNQCNTVDNPNVDEGYHRTCSVEGFTCEAKRDVHSDNRFVACTQGGQSVRFTWLPA